MARIVKIKKGLDIPVAGVPGETLTAHTPTYIGITPDDFPGYRWRPVVKPGDKVVQGTPLFQAKEADDIALVSPVAGKVEEIRRGERRHILDMRIKPEGSADECVNIELPLDIPQFNRENGLKRPVNADACEIYRNRARAVLKNSGLWAMMRQRPYDIVPEAEAIPDNIFVTAFDSAPCAPDLMLGIEKTDIYKGIEVLDALTPGFVYIGCRQKDASDLEVVANHKAVVTIFEGPHPAGNVGPQIAAISPIAKGENVWTLDIRTLAAIGYLFNTNTLTFNTILAVTGPEVKDPHYVQTVCGADIASILAYFSLGDAPTQRTVAGNVLTGFTADRADGYIRFPYRQITVIEEGEHVDEFMGWASMSPRKFSVKRMFPSGLLGGRGPFRFDTRLLGGHRAMILTGELDSVFPFDIYPEYLLKATIAADYDRMEKLGIYEVAPEDFALPEFVDTSKEPLQRIIRDGLDRLRSEQ